MQLKLPMTNFQILLDTEHLFQLLFLIHRIDAHEREIVGKNEFVKRKNRNDLQQWIMCMPNTTTNESNGAWLQRAHDCEYH